MVSISEKLDLLYPNFFMFFQVTELLSEPVSFLISDFKKYKKEFTRQYVTFFIATSAHCSTVGVSLDFPNTPQPAT